MNFLKSDKNTQISQSVLVGAILAVVGGFLDAYTYVLRGKVFANAQTGNIVLLGIKLVDGAFSEILKYCAPILAFVLGVIVVEIVRKRYRYAPKVHWRQINIAIEMLVLLVIGFVPSDPLNNIYVNVAVSFVCSMQVQSFRLLNGSSYATTMCTGNLRTATEEFFIYGTTKEKSALSRCLQYLTIIFFFIVGAVLGAICSKYVGVMAVWVCCALLLVVFCLMFIRKKMADPSGDVTPVEAELAKKASDIKETNDIKDTTNTEETKDKKDIEA